VSRVACLSDIESHIATIGRALWARDGRGSGGGRATVMIGSGFSKNAVPETGNPRPFPIWKDLATHLVNEILPGCDGCTCLDLEADVYPPGAGAGRVASSCSGMRRARPG
jgi:hypothetical protein